MRWLNLMIWFIIIWFIRFWTMFRFLYTATESFIYTFNGFQQFMSRFLLLTRSGGHTQPFSFYTSSITFLLLWFPEFTFLFVWFLALLLGSFSGIKVAVNLGFLIIFRFNFSFFFILSN